MRFLSALMPREARFFALFNQHADLVQAGGAATLELVRLYADTARRAALIAATRPAAPAPTTATSMRSFMTPV